MQRANFSSNIGSEQLVKIGCLEEPCVNLSERDQHYTVLASLCCDIGYHPTDPIHGLPCQQVIGSFFFSFSKKIKNRAKCLLVL